MRVTKTQMTAAVNAAKWDVKANKTMVFMADTDNPAYWEEQAKMLIREASEQRILGGADKYIDKLDMAIRLLMLARIANTSGAC